MNKKNRLRRYSFSIGFACLPLAHIGLAADASTLQSKGEYIAKAANCVSCHTTEGGQPFAGGVPFETPFGTIYSPNITPDQQTGIGSWSESEFRAALKQGLRPDGEHLYPVFPYTAYTGMSDDDVSALYAYLQDVPTASATHSVNQLSFPFNQRWLMAAWKMMFFNEEPAPLPEASSEAWQRGRYLVTTLGHCGECHSPRNWLGAVSEQEALSGGSYLDDIPGGKIKPWFAVNLTPADEGLAKWSADDIQQYLKTGLNAYATSFGPMNKVIMNSTSHLTEEDIAAMAIYLKSLPAKQRTDSLPVADADSLAKGRELYAIHCATCHLPTGKGDPDTGPALIGNPVVLGSDPSSLVNAILYGPELPKTALPVQRTPMGAYEHKLDDSDVADISTYIRNSWGNKSTPVLISDVLEQR